MVRYNYWRPEDKFVLSSVTHIDNWIFSVNLSTCDSVASSSADHAVRQHRAHGPRPPSSDSRDLGVRSHVFQRFLLVFKTGFDWSGRSWSIFGSVTRGTGRRRWSRSRRQRCLSSPLHCSLSSIVRSPLSRMWTLPGQFLSGACTKIGRLYQTLSVRSDSSSSESVNTTRWREISVWSQSSRTTSWLHIRNNTKDERDFPYNIEIR